MSAPAARPRKRILLGAFGDPGHAFPMIALGRALLARGHDVWLQSWERWREPIEAEGLRFAAAPEYADLGGAPIIYGFYEAAERAARDTVALVEQAAPDVVVADILTLGPALAGELCGVPVATLIPHVYPIDAPGLPIYSIGARLPRSAAGRRMWELLKQPMRRSAATGRADLNRVRGRLGLARSESELGGLSTALTLVGTFSELEYPRSWPANAHLVGPLVWEPPAAAVHVPDGPEPLILIAPSTSQDRRNLLLRRALAGLADQPLRLLATWNRRGTPAPVEIPANATAVDWLSYGHAMRECDAVICHAGHGTMTRALAYGKPVLACPIAGDMNENAARLAWSGAGLRLPARFINSRSLRHAVRLLLQEPRFATRARQIAASLREEPAQHAARLVERLALRDDAANELRGWDSNPQPLG